MQLLYLRIVLKFPISGMKKGKENINGEREKN